MEMQTRWLWETGRGLTCTYLRCEYVFNGRRLWTVWRNIRRASIDGSMREEVKVL